MRKVRFAVCKKKQTTAQIRLNVMTKRTDKGKNNNIKDGRKFKIRYLNACCQ